MRTFALFALITVLGATPLLHSAELTDAEWQKIYDKGFAPVVDTPAYRAFSSSAIPFPSTTPSLHDAFYELKPICTAFRSTAATPKSV